MKFEFFVDESYVDRLKDFKRKKGTQICNKVVDKIISPIEYSGYKI
jgi:hypothetical protein